VRPRGSESLEATDTTSELGRNQSEVLLPPRPVLERYYSTMCPWYRCIAKIGREGAEMRNFRVCMWPCETLRPLNSVGVSEGDRDLK